MSIVASQVVATIGAPLALTTTHGTVGATLGTVLAGVSGSVIALHDIQLQLVAGTAATTCYIQSGTAQVRNAYFAAVGDGLVFVPPAGKEIRLASGAALVLNNAAGTVAYTVRTAYEGA
jgi:hypothetical protein